MMSAPQHGPRAPDAAVPQVAVPQVAVTAVHPILRVRVHDVHEIYDPDATRRRLEHADEAIGAVALAWFERDERGAPAIEPDGTYTVHVPAPGGALDRVRRLLSRDEGLAIAYEGIACGLGGPPSG